MSIPFLMFLVASDAQAQQEVEAQPDTRLISVFSETNRGMLCDPQNMVNPMVVLGELARRYEINLFALPTNTRLATTTIADRDIPDTVEARSVAWLIESGNGTAAEVGLPTAQHRPLILMRSALARYLEWAAAPRPGHQFRTQRLALGPSNRPGDLLLAFFEPVLGVRPAEGIFIECVVPQSEIAEQVPDRPQGPTVGRTVARPSPPASFALRGQIDDLLATRGSEEFKKASSATLAFTDNNEAGTTNFAINGVLGLGARFGRDDALYAFAHYTRNDQETDVAGDDDDSKDIHSISPGIFFRHPMALGHRMTATAGFVGYGTFDIRNDAELVRGRLVLADMTVWLGRGRGYLCGSQRELLFLYADCRASLFIEGAEVLDAGRNTDLLSNIDDEYFGGGTELSLILSPQGAAWIRPLTLRGTYRAMGIISGELDNPERLELSLNYAVPIGNPAGGPGLSFGLVRVLGENFETFQHEDQWKLTVGLKF